MPANDSKFAARAVGGRHAAGRNAGIRKLEGVRKDALMVLSGNLSDAPISGAARSAYKSQQEYQLRVLWPENRLKPVPFRYQIPRLFARFDPRRQRVRHVGWRNTSTAP